MKLEKILLVDDDKVSNVLTESLLRKQLPDSEVHVEMNGEDAIQYLKTCGDQLPNLILLDIDMPRMDGFEFLKWHNESIYADKMEVVMLSLSNRSGDVEKSLAFKAVRNYIAKPLDQKKIEFIIKDF